MSHGTGEIERGVPALRPTGAASSRAAAGPAAGRSTAPPCLHSARHDRGRPFAGRFTHAEGRRRDRRRRRCRDHDGPGARTPGDRHDPVGERRPRSRSGDPRSQPGHEHRAPLPVRGRQPEPLPRRVVELLGWLVPTVRTVGLRAPAMGRPQRLAVVERRARAVLPPDPRVPRSRHLRLRPHPRRRRHRASRGHRSPPAARSRDHVDLSVLTSDQDGRQVPRRPRRQPPSADVPPCQRGRARRRSRGSHDRGGALPHPLGRVVPGDREDRRAGRRRHREPAPAPRLERRPPGRDRKRARPRRAVLHGSPAWRCRRRSTSMGGGRATCCSTPSSTIATIT